MIGKPLILGLPTKEWNGLRCRQDHGFSYAVFQPGFLGYVSDQASFPCMGQWGLITSSISQHHSHLYAIMSSVFGGMWAVSLMLRGYWPLWWQLASYPEPKRCFGEVSGWESTSSPEAISCIGSHTMWPSTPCNDGKGEVPFWELYPLCLQSYVSPCYSRSVTYALLASTQFTGSLEFTIGTKA